MARLAADKNAFVWEEQITKRVPANQFDVQKRTTFLREIKDSGRISRFIKDMSDDEILDFYFFHKRAI
jgi:ATP-dependent DNA helicase RecG